ncbi:MAG: hypothetical protein ACRDQT_08605 [Gaiellaceae bacterium]
MHRADVAPDAPPGDGSAHRPSTPSTVWWLVAVVALVSAYAVWITSPRFDIETPSLVDDWAAITRADDQLRDILGGSNPEEQRFRPGWILWNYLQWHTLDAPYGIVGPNVWNVARILVLVCGLTLLTALALPAPGSRLEAAVHAAAAGVPAFVVVSAPKLAVDLTRFGPQEPLLVGAMALGGSLLVLGGRRLLDPRRTELMSGIGLLVSGCAFWALGVYQKEVSLAVLPLVAAVLIAGRARLGEWPRLSRFRKLALGASGVVAVLPLLHVAIESALITARGDLVYGAEVDRGRGAWAGIRELWSWAHEALPPAGRAMAVAAVALTAFVLVWRRKIDAIAVGALVSGALAFVMAGQSGVATTRYFIPTYALFAVALAISLVRLPSVVQLAGVLLVAFAFLPSTAPRDEVRHWATDERLDGDFVRAVAERVSAGCVVASAGLDVEPGQAFPVLMAIEGDTTSPCPVGGAYFVLGPLEEWRALAGACAEGELQKDLDNRDVADLYWCERLGTTPVRDPRFGLVMPAELVELRRLRPDLSA